MPITQYNSSVRQMSQSKFNSMKNASGKIPDLANQIVMTNSEDENYDYLRMKLLWTNSNPTGAFVAQTISIDLSNYDLFLISFNIRPLTRNIKYSEIMHKGDTDLYLIGVDLDGNRKTRSVSINNAGITFGSSSTDYTDEVVPYQIYGILKTPSMIYTGDALTAGNGISIENGVISRIPLFKDYFVQSYTSAFKVTAETSVGSFTFNKSLNDSNLVINYSCPLINNSNGYGSYIGVNIDGTPAGTRCLRNSSGMFCYNEVVRNISSGSHTISFFIGCGAGYTTVPAYENITATIVEVL